MHDSFTSVERNCWLYDISVLAEIKKQKQFASPFQFMQKLVRQTHIWLKKIFDCVEL